MLLLDLGADLRSLRTTGRGPVAPVNRHNRAVRLDWAIGGLSVGRPQALPDGREKRLWPLSCSVAKREAAVGQLRRAGREKWILAVRLQESEREYPVSF